YLDACNNHNWFAFANGFGTAYNKLHCGKMLCQGMLKRVQHDEAVGEFYSGSIVTADVFCQEMLKQDQHDEAVIGCLAIG
ncbi:hypothetical protein, partial [Limnovirga soli]|uniref:hypothetical protein n=1 Tax=Limnovirga soli TaxID=2656915 RepID=UPI001C0EB61C